MSGESFFPINHTKYTKQKPVSKGDFAQEQKPQPGESRSGIKSYAELMEERQADRIASALAGVSAALNEYNGTTRDENKGKTVSPEAIYRENILYAARVTRLVLEMRKDQLRTSGSQDASKLLEENSGMTGVNSALKESFTADDEINSDFWNKKIDEEETGSDDQSRWGRAA